MPVTIKKLPVDMQLRVSLCKNKFNNYRECINGLAIGYQDTEELTSKTLIEVQLEGGKLLTVPIDFCCNPDPVDVLFAIATSSGRK